MEGTSHNRVYDLVQGKLGGQRQLPVPTISQTPSALNTQYAKVSDFGIMCPEPCHLPHLLSMLLYAQYSLWKVYSFYKWFIPSAGDTGTKAIKGVIPTPVKHSLLKQKYPLQRMTGPHMQLPKMGKRYLKKFSHVLDYCYLSAALKELIVLGSEHNLLCSPAPTTVGAERTFGMTPTLV